MIISRKQTDAVLCGCAALLLAFFAPVPVRAQDTTTPSAQTAPDNTAHNKNHAKTADQQPNNPADRDTTQRIRKSIVGDSGLSTYAHNVKIITVNGVVTLKGPVRSAEEKQSVEDKATAVAGAGKVKDQLSIKPESK